MGPAPWPYQARSHEGAALSPPRVLTALHACCSRLRLAAPALGKNIPASGQWLSSQAINYFPNRALRNLRVTHKRLFPCVSSIWHAGSVTPVVDPEKPSSLSEKRNMNNRIINLTVRKLRPAFAAAALVGLMALSVSAADQKPPLIRVPMNCSNAW